MSDAKAIAMGVAQVAAGVAGAAGPIPAAIAQAAVGLLGFAFDAASQGLSREAVAQQLQDQMFDLITQIKAGSP